MVESSAEVVYRAPGSWHVKRLTSRLIVGLQKLGLQPTVSVRLVSRNSIPAKTIISDNEFKLNFILLDKQTPSALLSVSNGSMLVFDEGGDAFSDNFVRLSTTLVRRNQQFQLYYARTENSYTDP